MAQASANFHESFKFSATENDCQCQKAAAGCKTGENVKEEVFEEKYLAVLKSSSSSDEEEFREKKEYHNHKHEGVKGILNHLLPGHKKENCESVRIKKHAEKKHGGLFGNKEDCSESLTVKHFEEKKLSGRRC